MPRKSKGLYGKYSQSNLDKAVAEVRAGTLSYAKASQKYGVPRSTICDHATGKIQPGSTPGRKPALPSEVEKELVSKVVTASERGFGVSRLQLMVKAGQVAKKLQIKTPFKNNIAGKDWFLGLKERHPELSIRKPQKLSTARSRCMNPEAVSKYFSTLEEIQSQLPEESRASVIWNMDETGLSLEHVPQAVVARKGANTVPGRVSCSRENITVIACTNANGDRMPPMVIVKGKTHKSLWSFNTSDGPAGAHWTWQQKAWTDDLLGQLWFRNVFLPNCGTARPQVLILDQHRSHEVSELLELAVERNIIVFGLPPHTSHWLQPLDKGCFGPLTKAYNMACSNFMSESPNNVVCKATWAGLFKKAWEGAMSPQNIKQGFKVTGIYPLDPNMIPERAFAPYLTRPDASEAPASSAPISPPAASSTPLAAMSFPPATISTPPATISTPPATIPSPPATASTPPATTSIPPATIPSPPATASTPPADTSIPPAIISSPLATASTPAATISSPPASVADVDSFLTADELFNLLTQDREVNIQLQAPEPGSVVDLPVFVNTADVIESVFDKKPEVTKKIANKKRQAYDGARVLTSSEVVQAKRRAREEKEEKERQKEERKKKREEKQKSAITNKKGKVANN